MLEEHGCCLLRSRRAWREGSRDVDSTTRPYFIEEKSLLSQTDRHLLTSDKKIRKNLATCSFARSCYFRVRPIIFLEGERVAIDDDDIHYNKVCYARIADRQTDRAGSIAAQGKAKGGNCDKPRSHTGRHVQSRAMGRRQNGRRGIKRRFTDLAKHARPTLPRGKFLLQKQQQKYTWLADTAS